MREVYKISRVTRAYGDVDQKRRKAADLIRELGKDTYEGKWSNWERVAVRRSGGEESSEGGSWVRQ